MASKNIKGITIEIDGNTQPLQNALNDLNKQTKSVNKELNQVNQALKLDPGNAEQVARKLELLEQQADLAQKKVEALKAAQKEMDAQGVDKASKEYQSLTTQIAKAEGEYNKIIATAKNTKEEFDKVSESTKLLNTYLAATGQTADDLKNIEGISKLVNDFEAGSLGAQGFNKILNALSQELTGTTRNADLLKNALSSGNFTEVSQALNKLTTDASGYRTELNDLQNAQTRLNTYFTATETTVKDFGNVLGSELTAKIESGKASSQELATALDKIGASAIQNSGDLDKFKATLDSVDSGVSFERINSELNSLGSEFKEGESDVEGFKSKLESIADSSAASALADVSDQIGDLGDKFTEFGAGAIEAAGIVESSQNQIRISLGATEEEAAAVAEHAKNVFNQNFGETQEEVTNVMVEIQKSIQGVNDSNIEDITSKFMTLKQAGVDEDDAIRGVKSSMEAWGLTAEQALDLMTTGMQNVYDPAHELGDIMGEYSPLMEQSGYSATEFLTALKEGMDNGAYSVDKVADLIKEMGIRISDGSIASAVTDLDQQFQGMGVNFEQVFTSMSEKGASNKEIFNALVQEINKLPDSTSQAAAASALFGTQGEDAGMRVLNAVAGAKDEFSNFSGAADQARDANETAVGSMEAKWRALGQAFAPLGEDLAEIANTILDAVIPVVEKVVDWFENMPEPIKKVIEVIGVLVTGFVALAPVITAIMPVLSAIGAAFSVVWSVISAGWTILTALGSALGTIITAIGSVIATIGAPFIAAIAAVVAVIVGLIAYFNNWGGCADWLNEKWSQFIEWLGTVFGGLGESIGTLWNNFTQGITDKWNEIWTGIQEGWNTVVEWFTNIFTGISETVGGAWNTFTQGITDAWNLIWTTIQGAWETVVEWFTTIFDNLGLTELWNNAVSGITETWNNIWSGIQTGWDTTKTWISDTFNGVKDSVTSAWDGTKLSTEDAWGNMQKTVFDCSQGMSNDSKQQLDQLDQAMGAIWKQSLDNTDTTWDDIENAVRKQASGMNQDVQDQLPQILSSMKENWEASRNTTDDKWGQIRDTVTSKAQELKDNLSNKWNQVVNDFSNIWNGLKDKASQIWENVKRIVSDGVNALKNLMNFHWELPQIKLPHFSISGQFSLNPPQIPHISVDWYKKGGILTAPTIFGASGNTLLGGGEAGAEAVAPIETLTSYVEKAVKNNIDMTETNNLLKQLIELQNTNLQVVLDSGTLVGAITPQLDSRLAQRQKRKARQ